MPEVRVVARCHPTEDRDKVAGAMLALFPDLVMEGDDPVVGTGQSTERFAELLKRHRIRSAARAAMRRGTAEGTVRFALNKQVAAAGKVSFSEERHPLGDLEVVLVADDVERLVDELTLASGEGGSEGA